MDVLTLLAGVFVVVAVYGISVYNRLVSKRNLAEEGFSGVDVQLKRRYDLVPNLVETVKGYAKHESETLEKVTQWRAKAQGATNLDDRFRAEAGLSQALANVFAVSESYPDLKADSSFTGIQGQLSSLEDQIQLSRRYYNGTVRDLNTLVEMFPSNIVANLFSFQKKPFFELGNEAEREVQKVSFS